MKNVLLACFMMTAGTVWATTYYVDKNKAGASDANTGTANLPWLTIQKAVSVAAGRDTVYVRNGSYSERVQFTGSGAAGQYITFKAYPGDTVIISRGFRVTGNYNSIKGFIVTPGETSTDVFNDEKSHINYYWSTAGQICLAGSHNRLSDIEEHDEANTSFGVPALTFFNGSYNTVANINLHHCQSFVFTNDAAGLCRYNTISGGTVHHTADLLGVLGSDYNTIENLDLHDPGQVAKGPNDGNASDGLNLDGTHLTIRNCKIHNIFQMISTQHTDAIQWWNTADDLVIEGCIIGSYATGGDLNGGDNGHIQWESDYSGTSQRVIIRNNVFLGDAGYYWLSSAPSQIAANSANDWQLIGNTFINNKATRTDYASVVHRWIIKNNIFHFTQTWPSSDAQMDYNCYVGAAVGANDGAHSFRNNTVTFVNPDISAATRYGIDADWRPATASPLAGAGVALAALTTDKNGFVRPDPPTIGAYEYATQSVRISEHQSFRKPEYQNTGNHPSLPNPMYVAELVRYLRIVDNPVICDLAGSQVDKNNLWQTGIYLVQVAAGQAMQKVIVVK